ncbi:hypothetical protein SAM40697_3906 [Streptomyces ambofaciens]|uniref:Transposase n=1 Tax=Streptomyces ambofaciens TaxID=1889 RepID=A0ABM6B2C3_STRAM|nr:hypothetical protein [Streptomyces ambofaciens]ANB07864.1 hypothetical protein SAM40697_3906 [Streptomyces ambofaciens]
MQRHTYSLDRWEDRSGHRQTWTFGYRGTAGEFGKIEVVYPVRRHGDRHVTEVRGDAVPTMSFDGWAYGRKPSLFCAQFSVGRDGIRLKRNRWAQTRAGRALRMRVAGRDYRYLATTARHRDRALVRDGVEIRSSRQGKGARKKAVFTVLGPADATDLALAAVMCGVNTRNLTRGGAVRAFFNRSLSWLEVFQ